MKATELSTGVVKKVMKDFGFIAPQDGGKDIYFNAKSLGDDHASWGDFVAIVQKSFPAHVTFRREEFKGKESAAAVIAIDSGIFAQLDADGDGMVTDEEMQAFLSGHPAHLEASKTMQEKRAAEAAHQKKENEAECGKRGELFAQLSAKEDKIWAKIAHMRDQSTALNNEANKLWGEGDKQGSKDKRKEIEILKAEMAKLKHEVQALDEENNEAMFKYVQENEHDGQPIDGTWIDLHGLSAEFGLRKCEAFLIESKGKGIKKIEVIPGAGNHSGAKGPVVKGMVWTNKDSLLNKAKNGEHPELEGLDYDKESEGSVIVTFP